MKGYSAHLKERALHKIKIGIVFLTPYSPVERVKPSLFSCLAVLVARGSQRMTRMPKKVGEMTLKDSGEKNGDGAGIKQKMKQKNNTFLSTKP